MAGKVVVKSQEARPSELPLSLADEYRKKMGELIKLPKEVERKLKSWLSARIKEWEEDTATLHQNLKDDNDLVEGVVEQTDFPWEGACNTHLPIPESHMKVYRGTLRRSTLGSNDVIWTAEADPEIMETVPEIVDVIPKISAGLNWLAKNKWNITECLKGIYWTTPRDGLGLMQITWEETYVPTTDTVFVTSLPEFKKKFMDPESAGLSEAEYFDLFEKARTATPDAPLEVPINTEKCEYRGCKGEIIELVDFITIPSVVQSIRHESCVGYGKLFRERIGIMKKKGKAGTYFDDVAQKVAKKAKAGSNAVGEYRASQDQIDGISRAKSYEVENIGLTVKLDLSSFGMSKNDPSFTDGERKYQITFNKTHNELLELRMFPYRIDNVATFKIEDRPNRLIGRNIPGQTREISQLIDATTRQRVNSRTISHVPTFIGDSDKKKEFDLNNPDRRFYPGKEFWAPGGTLGFDQMKVQPTDMGDGMADEQNWSRLLELLTGAGVTLASGQTQAGDANAPGNKTAMMLQQSSLRMEEPLDTMRDGIDQVGEICTSLLYQFGDNEIAYKKTGDDGKSIPEVFSKRFLRVGVRVKMSSVTVTDNPDSEMQRWMNLHAQLMQTYPPYAQNPEAQTTLLRHALAAGNVSIKDRIIPTIAEVQQQQVQIQKQAMIQMIQEKQAAAEQQKQDMLKQKMGAVRQDIAIHDLAKKKSEISMGEPPAGGPTDGQ